MDEAVTIRRFLVSPAGTVVAVRHAAANARGGLVSGALDRHIPWLTGISAVLLALLIAETVLFIEVIERSWTYLGMDYMFYRDVGARWLHDGSWYLPFQFAPHEFTNMVSNVYPPTALFLFVPAALMPWVFWWAVPIAVLAYALRRMQPAPWAWPIILLLMMWPRSIGGYLYGNTTIWTTAGLAAGLVWGWPIILLAVKTTAWPWALLVVRRREAWIAGAVLAVVSIPMIPLWIDYFAVVRNQTSPVTPSALLGDVPPMLIPAVAWFSARAARSRRAAMGPNARVRDHPVPLATEA